MHKILIFMSVIAVGSIANAGVFLRAGGMTMQSSVTYVGGAQASGCRVYGDLGVGYVREKGFAFGGLYQMEVPSQRTSYGPSIGWVTRKENGFYGFLNYFVSSTGPTKGTGYQVDVGYKLAVKRFSLAPQLSYKVFNDDDGGGNTTTRTFFDPYFVLSIEF